MSGSLLRSPALQLPEAAFARSGHFALANPASPWNASSKYNKVGFATPGSARSPSKRTFATAIRQITRHELGFGEGLASSFCKVSVNDTENFECSPSQSQSPFSCEYRPGHVWFSSPSNTSVDITPYSSIYGIHPRFFHFDENGSMQLIQSRDQKGAGSTPSARTRQASSASLSTSTCTSSCALFSASECGEDAFRNVDISAKDFGSASAPLSYFCCPGFNRPSRSLELHGSSSRGQPFKLVGQVGAAKQRSLTAQRLQSTPTWDAQASDVSMERVRPHGAPDLADSNPYGVFKPRLRLGPPSPHLHARQRPQHAVSGQCSRAIGPYVPAKPCGSQSLPSWSSRMS